MLLQTLITLVLLEVHTSLCSSAPQLCPILADTLMSREHFHYVHAAGSNIPIMSSMVDKNPIKALLSNCFKIYTEIPRDLPTLKANFSHT